jgi:hypothetical protein
LIGAVTKPGDLVVDPAAGGFLVLRAAMTLGRKFIGSTSPITGRIRPRPDHTNRIAHRKRLATGSSGLVSV